MAGFAIMLEYAGATNNWSTYFRPIISCPGIMPMILTLLWSRQTKAAAIIAPVLGLISGVATWLSLSWYWSGGVNGGAINITTTQAQLPGLYGAIVSFFSPALYSVVVSLIWPGRFDWREFLRIDLIEDESANTSSITSSENVNEIVKPTSGAEKQAPLRSVDEKGDPLLSPAPTKFEGRIPIDDVVHPFGEDESDTSKNGSKSRASISLSMSWSPLLYGQCLCIATTSSP